MSVLELFCAVDDFWKTFGDEWQRNGYRTGDSASGQASCSRAK